jgi:hypothetical protein
MKANNAVHIFLRRGKFHLEFLAHKKIWRSSTFLEIAHVTAGCRHCTDSSALRVHLSSTAIDRKREIDRKKNSREFILSTWAHV